MLVNPRASPPAKKIHRNGVTLSLNLLKMVGGAKALSSFLALMTVASLGGES